ncbi:uncharacterized protein LOC110350111 isoform X2 [Heterocephalus glaber]|uniref:Uncharacterized protein LOC110350111 isoform X2 n=1 Tax=Heterocephalus glaber TaxID=10181 RepID=A0AAX6T6J9_HETGA|nr:uncharacterized protein LOC110350111 isoform X2 [Heterocephalus glaber]
MRGHVRSAGTRHGRHPPPSCGPRGRKINRSAACAVRSVPGKRKNCPESCGPSSWQRTPSCTSSLSRVTHSLQLANPKTPASTAPEPRMPPLPSHGCTSLRPSALTERQCSLPWRCAHPQGTFLVVPGGCFFLQRGSCPAQRTCSMLALNTA